MKTNAMRVLEQAGIDFRVHAYDVDDQHVSAEEVAAALEMAPETVFKTLLAEGDQTGHLFAVIPAGTELDLRALAAASGDKRVRLVPLRDVLPVCGYERGAVTPLAGRRSFPVYIDETAALWPNIGISGGERGIEIVLAPADLVRVTGGRLADIAR